MGELHRDHSDLSKVSLFDHLPCLMDHLVPGVPIGHCDDLLLLFCQSLEFQSLFCREAERFLTYHMQSCFQRSFAHLVMELVGSRYGDHFYGVLSQCLLLEHLLVIGIAPLRGYPDVGTELSGPLGVYVKGAGYQLEHPVTSCSRAVYITDLAAPPPTDHCPAIGPIESDLFIEHTILPPCLICYRCPRASP